MNPLILCAIMLFLGIGDTTGISYTSVVQTNTGPVRGQLLTTVRKSLRYASFRGIPFAEIPVGKLRFKPPVAKKSWARVLDATKEANICMQYNELNSSAIGSEDCLYLNIYTPHTTFSNSKKRALKAVMVWIYGGGFTTGFSISSFYGPDFLLEDDVIVVSFNYRLGPFGFLNVNHENANGNAGLKDQTLALKWIKKNIIKFGGDPNRITIFGQSAGAASVDFHVLSNMSAGLFNRSIAMSGSSIGLFWSIQGNEDARFQAFALGSKLGIETENVDELLEALLEASANDIILKANSLSFVPFRPTLEKPIAGIYQERFMSECALNRYLSGNYHKGPHMLGFTSNEAKASDKTILTAFSAVALQLLKDAKIALDFPIIRKYLKLGDLSKLSQSEVQELIKTGSDIFFVTNIDTKQKYLNLHNNYPIYYYRFAFETANYAGLAMILDHIKQFNLTGVGHAEDLPYLFYIPFFRLPFTEPDIALTINRYVRLMTNFAKYGNPTPRRDSLLNITWPNSGNEGRHLEINKELTIGPRPIDRSVEVYETVGIGNSAILHNCISLKC